MIDKNEKLQAAKQKALDAKRHAEERKAAPKIESPLKDVPVTGDIEADDAAEASAILGAVGKARQQLAANQDQGYWCSLVFQSTDQMRAFISQSGWGEFLDSSGVFLNGEKIAEKLGVVLPPHFRGNAKHGADARLVSEVGIFSKESK